VTDLSNILNKKSYLYPDKGYMDLMDLGYYFLFFLGIQFSNCIRREIKIISHSHLNTFVLAEETSLSLFTGDRHGEDENAKARFKPSKEALALSYLQQTH